MGNIKSERKDKPSSLRERVKKTLLDNPELSPTILSERFGISYDFASRIRSSLIKEEKIKSLLSKIDKKKKRKWR